MPSADAGKAALYAIRALVDGLRDAGVLDMHTIRCIEERTTLCLNAAGAIDSAGVGFDADEAVSMRMGMWWLRECTVPTDQESVCQFSEHYKPQDWPALEARLRFSADAHGGDG